MRSSERRWEWHALLTKYKRPDWDGTVMWWEERTKTPWKELWWQRSTDAAEEAMGDMIQQDMKSPWLKKELTDQIKDVNRKDPSGWPLPWRGLIQAGRRLDILVLAKSVICYIWGNQGNCLGKICSLSKNLACLTVKITNLRPTPTYVDDSERTGLPSNMSFIQEIDRWANQRKE